jgi:biotin carboxyl carrier protein
MKLMNEIESDVSGTILKIMSDNSTPVEYNQTLFVIKPD